MARSEQQNDQVGGCPPRKGRATRTQKNRPGNFRDHIATNNGELEEQVSALGAHVRLCTGLTVLKCSMSSDQIELIVDGDAVKAPNATVSPSLCSTVLCCSTCAA
jgi:hypothetical protein